MFVARMGNQVVEQATPLFYDDFKREVQAALEEASIFDIGSYGWINENDPDPEFIGHAMWQVDAPPLDEIALFGESRVRRRPKDIEKEILTSGEDFWGLMEASRLSMGMALVWKRQAQDNPINASSFFWLHHTDAFLKLAIASDRLRDLLIIACTGAHPKIYKNQRPKPFYVAPFENGCELITKRGVDDQHLVEPLGALPVIGNQLYQYISRRNAIVHEVATRMARFIRKCVSDLQQRYDELQMQGPQAESQRRGDAVPRTKARTRKAELEVDRAVEELKQWYTLLIHASNYVFQIEYWTRRVSVLIRD
jgi:hypothetical protein